MKKFSFKPKHSGNPNPNFRPPASVNQDSNIIDEIIYEIKPKPEDWGEYIAHLNILLNIKDERISTLVKERHWKDKRIRELETENEKLKDAIRNSTYYCEICKGYDEKSPNYGYTDFCENCFWYPWADEEQCPNKWELKE